MSIMLQSTVGGFSPEFKRRLPALEQAMIAHGLEPSSFVISKDRASAAVVVRPGTVLRGPDGFRPVTLPASRYIACTKCARACRFGQGGYTLCRHH